MATSSNHKHARLLSGTCFVALTAMAVPALAQEPTRGFEEIVVTARSQAESLMQVPVAVTALSAGDITRYATTDLLKLAQQRPDVEIYSGGSRAGAAFIIRGIGTTADTAGVENSVSIAIDGSQTHRPRIVHSGLFDLQQIEIMKGPQALFFGKNSSAGVVSITSADPGSEVGGYVRGGYEFEAKERYVEAAVSAPVNDKLALRFAGRYSKLRGWIHNIAQARPDPANPAIILPAPFHRWNGSESMGGRITVLWKPSDNYTSNMKFSFGKYTDNGPTQGVEIICGTPKPFWGAAGLTDNNSDCKLNGVNAMTDLPPVYVNSRVGDQRWNNGVPFTDSSSMLLTWQQSLDLDNLTILSKTGYSKLSFVSRGNFNYMEFGSHSGGSDDFYKGYSQELRMVTKFAAPLNFTVGAFYEHTRAASGSALFVLNFGPEPTTGSYVSGINEALEHNKTLSFFGQARWDITDDVELAGGARWTHVKKKAVQGQPNYVHDTWQALGLLTGEGVYLQDSINERNVSPEATITWHANPDTTVYAAFKTGYKTGGIAQPALVSNANIGNVTFKPEKSIGGEIGYKGYMDDRRLRLSATAFYYKFKGLQLTSFNPALSAYNINNAADVKQTGAELEADYKATDELTVRAAANFVSAKYGTFTNSPCFSAQTAAEGCVAGLQNLTGRQVHRAPKWSASVGFSYDTPISSDLMVGINGDIRFRSGAFTTEKMSPFSYQSSYALLNAGVRVYQEGDGWELSLIGRNLTNRRVIGFANDASAGSPVGFNQVSAYTVRTRELAIQITNRF